MTNWQYPSIACVTFCYRDMNVFTFNDPRIVQVLFNQEFID